MAKTQPEVVTLVLGEQKFLSILNSRLHHEAPGRLIAIGPTEILSHRKTAYFCSSHAPGSVILPVHDMARRLRDEGETVISGFHSPIEKDCLRILLRGKQPIIICPARAVETMQISKECRSAFDAGRVLFLSPFEGTPKRVTRESAAIRNRFVAALADRAYVAHASAGGQMAEVLGLLRKWSVPLIQF